MTELCGFCGSELTPWSLSMYFCTSQCQERWHRRRANPLLEEFIWTTGGFTSRRLIDTHEE